MSALFYIRDSQGNEDGPHSVEVLAQQLENGSLSRFSSIRREDQKRWRLLGAFTEFARAKTGLEAQVAAAVPVARRPPPLKPDDALRFITPSSRQPSDLNFSVQGALTQNPEPPAKLSFAHVGSKKEPTKPSRQSPPVSAVPPVRKPPAPPQPPPLPVFDPMERQRQLQQKEEAEADEGKSSPEGLPKWMWRTWGILLMLRFILWVADGHSAALGGGKLLSLPFVLLVFPLGASGYVLKKTSGDRDKAALAFIGTYLFLWVLAW
jgi:hypothetical protein